MFDERLNLSSIDGYSDAKSGMKYTVKGEICKHGSSKNS